MMPKAKKKTSPAQLEREIAEVLDKPSAKARRQAASQQRWQVEDAKDTTWRKETISQVKQWVEEIEPWDERYYSIVVKRLTTLVSFVRSFFPDVGAAPFDPYDAAALIVLPRPQALRLARKLFGGGPGIAKDLQSEDLSFNMDWFRPKNFQ